MTAGCIPEAATGVQIQVLPQRAAQFNADIEKRHNNPTAIA